MKLLLTSAGITNSIIEDGLRGLLGKPTDKAEIVFVPTAANPESGGKWWLVEDIRRVYDMGWKEFEIVDVAAVMSLDRRLWWPKFMHADVILVGGGNTFYLSYWMQRSGLFEALPDWLRTKVYVGISAGSMVVSGGLQAASHVLAASNFRVPEDMEYGDLGPSEQSSALTLDLVDVVIRPHFNSPLFPNIRESHIEKLAARLSRPLYAIDDQCALRVVDGEIDVIGSGQWQLYGH